MGFIKTYVNKRSKEKEYESLMLENKMEKIRTNTIALQLQRSAMERYQNSGYSHGGASHNATWADGYDAESLSYKSDIEENRKTLRQRSRDLAMNAPIATAAVNTTRTNIVGAGIVPKPKIDYEFLGISKEDACELERQIKREFSLWAESSKSDAADLNNFYELQQIAMLEWIKNGEGFALIQYGETTRMEPYSLRIKLIEADRVCSPGEISGGYIGYDQKRGSNTIINGIEIDQNGMVVAYHIASFFPGENLFNNPFNNPVWTRVKKRGSKTGNPNILHIFNSERAEQYRGVPMLAPVIQSIKQMTRYTEAEIMAAVINSMLSIFILTENGDDMEGFSGYAKDDNWNEGPIGGKKDDDKIKVGAGTVNFLRKGESVETVESKHPSGNFDSFISAFSNLVGAALDLPPEILLKKFSNNFSASKGALNEAWRSFNMRRKWFVADFCQPIYDLWMAEAVSIGRIKAPGFFTDPLIRKAYTNATWNGPAQGCLDPLKEVNAAEKRMKNGLSTHEDECASMNGSDFDDNVRTLENENKRFLKIKHKEED